MSRLRPVLLVVALAAFAACSDNGDRGTNPDPNPPDNTVASLTINGPGQVDFAGTIQLIAEARNKSGTLLEVEVQWSSSLPNVATVDGNGNVTAMSTGTTVISASIDTITATREIEVLPAIASISVSGNTVMSVGATQQLMASALSEGGVNLPAVFGWTTSAANVATVSNVGLVTATGVGNVTITATAKGVQGSINIEVVGAQGTVSTSHPK